MWNMFGLLLVRLMLLAGLLYACDWAAPYQHHSDTKLFVWMLWLFTGVSALSALVLAIRFVYHLLGFLLKHGLKWLFKLLGLSLRVMGRVLKRLVTNRKTGQKGTAHWGDAKAARKSGLLKR